MDPEGTKTAVPFLDATNHADRCSSGTADCSDLKKNALESTMVEACALFYMASNIFLGNLYTITLPETNIAPENGTSPKDSSLPTIHFQVLC